MKDWDNLYKQLYNFEILGGKHEEFNKKIREFAHVLSHAGNAAANNSSRSRYI